MLGNVHVVAHWQDAAGGRDASAGDDHGPVVQRRVLEEDVLDQAHVDVGVDDVAGLLVVVQGHFLLQDYEGAGLGARHGVAGVDHGQGHGVVLGLVLGVAEL